MLTEAAWLSIGHVHVAEDVSCSICLSSAVNKNKNRDKLAWINNENYSDCMLCWLTGVNRPL